MEPLISAFVSAWQRAFDFGGRSGRPEFWWFFLANFILLFVLNLLGSRNGFFWGIANLYAVAQILPNLAVTIRRLRDAGKAWLIYLLSQPSVLA